jgi:hypothetical protein
MSFSYFPNSTRSRNQRDYPSASGNTVTTGGDRVYPQLPAGITYTNIGSAGWTSYDDGYNTTAIPIGFTWPFNGTNYTQCYVSTNGHINFGSGSTSIGTTSNGIVAHYGDLWLQPGRNTPVQIEYQSSVTSPWFAILPYQATHDVWYTNYSFVQNNLTHNVFRIVAYCGKYGSDMLTYTQSGWRISLYKVGGNQFIEACLLDGGVFAASSTSPNGADTGTGIGPYNTSGVAACTLATNTADPYVWYSADNGITWFKKGRGVVQTTAPAYSAYPNANLKLVSVSQAQAYVSKQFADGTRQTTSDLSVNSETAVTMLRIAVGLGPRTTAESFLMDVLNSTDYAEYTNGGLKLGKIAGGTGEISSGDAIEVLKKAAGQTINATYDQRITTLLLAIAAKIVERPEAVSMYEFGYVNGPSRRLSSLFNLTYPGSSSDYTNNAPTSLSSISVGKYSGIPGTQGVLYNTSSTETTTVTPDAEKQVTFDTAYGYAVGQAVGSTYRLRWSNRYEVLNSFWSVTYNARNSSSSPNSTEVSGTFNVFWGGTNLNVPPGTGYVQGGTFYYPNYASWTNAQGTFTRGNLQTTVGPDKYGVTTKTYAITYVTGSANTN